MKFTYTNHSGVTEERDVTPLALLWLHSPSTLSPYLSGYNPGYFLECIAHDREDAIRHFALYNINVEMDRDNRWSIPHGMVTRAGIPIGYQNQDFLDGYRAGHANELFDFEKPAPWVVGYNAGRLALLNPE